MSSSLRIFTLAILPIVVIRLSIIFNYFSSQFIIKVLQISLSDVSFPAQISSNSMFAFDEHNWLNVGHIGEQQTWANVQRWTIYQLSNLFMHHHIVRTDNAHVMMISIFRETGHVENWANPLRCGLHRLSIIAEQRKRSREIEQKRNKYPRY